MCNATYMQKTIHVRRRDYDLFVLGLRMLARSRDTSESALVTEAVRRLVEENRAEIDAYLARMADES